MISEPAHAAILRRVAITAAEDARSAWKEAHASPTESRVRAAFRGCVLAARTLRNAAEVTPGEAGAMLAAAELVDLTAAKLKDQLARIVERSTKPAQNVR